MDDAERVQMLQGEHDLGGVELRDLVVEGSQSSQIRQQFPVLRKRHREICNRQMHAINAMCQVLIHMCNITDLQSRSES